MTAPPSKPSNPVAARWPGCLTVWPPRGRNARRGRAGEFGRRIRARRTELGKSQEQLARDSSLHWSYLGQVERGQRNVTLHNILKLAEVLEVDAGDLVHGLRAP
jgi:ribosome-binding protein aMBF1 (putative translation factor)